MKNSNKKAFFGILSLDAAIVLASIFITYVARFISFISSECLIKRMGYMCPSCGGTRCLYNFFKGNFAEAFGYNQFIFFAIIYALVFVVFLNLRYLFGLRFPEKPIYYMSHPTTIIVLAITYIIFGISRNFFLLPAIDVRFN